MESNQELFRQAILDAKAVRETSLASARHTLAEHFEPLVKSMFQETVENIEEDLEDESTMEERKTTHQKDVDAEKAGKKVAKDIEWDDKHKNESASMEDESTLDEILAELDALSEDDMSVSDLEEHTTTTAGYDEKAHTEKGNVNGSYSEKAKATHGSTNGSYTEKAKSSIHEAEEDDDTEEDDKDAKFDDKAEKAGKDLTKGIEGAHDQEGSEEGVDAQEVVDITVGELKDIIRDVFMTLQGGDMAADTAALDADTDLAADLGTDAADMAADDTEISLDEILAELEAEEGKMEEAALPKEIPGGEVDPKSSDVYKVEADLKEAIKTIKALKGELNEINLFNAKLMYVNKIFKAKNLSESQKTKVVNAFDRATSVKEVENTYKTLLESVSAETKKSSLKESVGFASKAIGNAPARPIVEADAFVTRWQQLAGIK
jgi:hypothetical protein